MTTEATLARLHFHRQDPEVNTVDDSLSAVRAESAVALMPRDIANVDVLQSLAISYG